MTKGEKAVEARLKYITDRLQKIYARAFVEVDKEIDHYYDGWNEMVEGEVVHHQGVYERYQHELQAFKKGAYKDPNGIYTDEQMFDRWWYSQEKRANHWAAVRDKIIDHYDNANVAASAFVNGELPWVFATSSNDIADIVQKSAIQKGITGIRFDLIDEYAAQAIMKGKAATPLRMLNYVPGASQNWHIKSMENALLQGVLLGDDIGRIADRFRTIGNMDWRSAVRAARTAVTNVQNAGKQDRFNELAAQGVYMTKIWNDVHDSTPVPERPWHWDASGQEVPYDKPFKVGDEYLMHPGDTSLGATIKNIANCRCNMHIGQIKFSSILAPGIKEKAGVKFVNI